MGSQKRRGGNQVLTCFRGFRGQRGVRDSDTVSLLRAVVTHHPLHHLHNHQRNQRIISSSLRLLRCTADTITNSTLVKTVPVCFVFYIELLHEFFPCFDRISRTFVIDKGAIIDLRVLRDGVNRTLLVHLDVVFCGVDIH